MSGSSSKSSEVTVEQGTLVFMLEGPGSESRKVIAEALTKALQQQGVKSPALLVAKLSAHTHPASIANAVAAASKDVKIDETAVESALSSALHAHVAKCSSFPAGLGKLLDAAQRRGMARMMITSIPEADAHALLQRAGEGEGGVQALSFAAEAAQGYPRADLWARVAKHVGKSTRGCVAVVDDGLACKTALAAGMKVIAVPTALTAHQDFCGADVLLDAWDEESPRQILDAALPAK